MKTTNKVVALITVAFLLLALMVMALFWSFSQVKEAAEMRHHTYVTIKSANDLLSDLKDAETGQRGYLLTGDAVYLVPYLSVRDTIGDSLEQLRQLILSSSARKHMETLAPLVDAKMAELKQITEIQRISGTSAAQTVIRNGHDKRLMDSIRKEISGVIEIEEGLLVQREAEFQSNNRRMHIIITIVSLFTLLVSLSLIYSIYRHRKQQISDLVHLETQHLLENQEATNRQLQHANITLQVSEEKLAVTLNSIGDAVIATDIEARVTRLNPVAEDLCGWKMAEAMGRPVDEIFHIINKDTRKPATIPIMTTLEHGTIQGLANHTVLIARNGSECDIADSCAPIRDRDGQVIGAVLVFRNVSKEYKVQQALRDSAAQIQTILNTVADGIVTLHSRGGIIETVNPATEQMFGYTAAELVSQNFSLLIPELDLEQSNGSLEHYSASDEARAVGLGREVSGRRKDGSFFPMEIAVSEMWLGNERHFTAILRDVSARKRAEDELLKAGALQRAIFNSANFSSIATDAKGVIQIFNVGAERMLGFTATEVMDKITPADISDPQEVIARAAALSIEQGTTITPGFEALVFKASRGIEDIYELTYIRKDGSRFPAVVSVTALRDAQEAIIGYLLIGTDNTARKLVEAERERLDQVLQDQNAELQNAKSVAEKANMAKSEFLSSMSHDLRSPLNAILGFAQLMQSDTPPPTPAQASSIDQILQGGWYLLKLINEILDLSAIESGRMSLSPEPVLLKEVMLECKTMIESQAQKRSIQLIFTQFDGQWFVHADRTRLKQVLLNLLSNAIKYNREKGTVVVECSASKPGRIRISITDTGAGLSPENIGQLFQPFNRLGQENSTEQGTGIGLVLSKRLIELMDGEIGMESKVGVGSVFWIELMSLDAPEISLEETEHKQIVQAPEGTKIHTVLYVEDNPANMKLVEQIIARYPNLRLLTAVNGNSGINIARISRPEVILMDINLPDISGSEALKILLADPVTTHIPVIAISANAMQRDIEKGLAAGFFRYLTKPIKVNELMDALNVALIYADKEMDLNK